MLILLLKKGTEDEIIIGDDIRVRLLNVYPESGQAQIGVEAPKDVIVDRKSIREKREARIQAVFDLHERHNQE